MTTTVAVLGASGYAGGELIRLVDSHPEFEVGYLGAHSRAGESLSAVHPHLRSQDRVLEPIDAAAGAEVDLVFLALPHGRSADVALEILASGTPVVDLGSDFRLDAPARYEEAYGVAHPHPQELGRWAYGLPELFASDIAGTDRVAVPGCYPTSAVLPLAPLLAAGLISPDGVVVDSLSGVSGAGRSVTEGLQFGSVAESVRAYSVLTHRHRPEMEQALGRSSAAEVSLTFTPHLVPMHRGILSTIYATTGPGVAGTDLIDELASTYEKSDFVSVVDGPPETRHVVGSNRCLISVAADERTRRAVVVSALDNLLKGAAGQAVQCANLMLGRDEASGLPLEGWMP